MIPSKTFNPMPALEQPLDHDDPSQFRALAAAMPQIVWTADPDGGLDFTNRRWHEYSRFTLEQSKGSGWADAVFAEVCSVTMNENEWTFCVRDNGRVLKPFTLIESLTCFSASTQAFPAPGWGWQFARKLLRRTVERFGFPQNLARAPVFTSVSRAKSRWDQLGALCRMTMVSVCRLLCHVW